MPLDTLVWISQACEADETNYKETKRWYRETFTSEEAIKLYELYVHETKEVAMAGD